MKDSITCYPAKKTIAHFWYHDSNWQEIEVKAEVESIKIQIRAKNDRTTEGLPKYYGMALAQIFTKKRFFIPSNDCETNDKMTNCFNAEHIRDASFIEEEADANK